jgi:hypothetical protein
VASSFLNTAGKVGRVTISERIEAGRREQRVLARVCRAAWRLEQAERERVWALVSARAEGISIRKLAAAAGLSPSRVHQLAAAADLDALDAALGELRAAKLTITTGKNAGKRPRSPRCTAPRPRQPRRPGGRRLPAAGAGRGRGQRRGHRPLDALHGKDQAERGKATSDLSVSTITLANRLIPAGSVIRWL